MTADGGRPYAGLLSIRQLRGNLAFDGERIEDQIDYKVTGKFKSIQNDNRYTKTNDEASFARTFRPELEKRRVLKAAQSS
jgi:hypothetical protein